MNLMRVFLAIAALLGGTAVAAGAFASHALRDHLSDRALMIFETGARYQMYHALALLAVALLLDRTDTAETPLIAAGIGLTTGVLLFSGSLYALSLSGISWLGAITPIGGVAFLVGWGSMLWAALRLK